MAASVGRYAKLGEESRYNTGGPPSPTPAGAPDAETGQVVAPPPVAVGAAGSNRKSFCGRFWPVFLILAILLLIGLGIAIPISILSGKNHFHDRKMGTSPPPPQTLGLGSLYRTAFHFQPEGNWMNDPNGPMYFNGWYHLFYQYNPGAAIWGNITWGHAISADLITWHYLPIALKPDQWYDAKGVWSGSATMHNNTPALIYTGDSNSSAQLQNIAFPANLSDPFLRDWKKADYNPIASTPAGVNKWDFRDPTTAWKGTDGTWRMIVGARRSNVDSTLVYRSKDFKTWTLKQRALKTAPSRAGMWECPDFFPVSRNGTLGLDTSANGVGLRYVLKASFDDSRIDYYSVGSYDEAEDIWWPVDPALDISTGLRYDYGRFYASKTFYDSVKQRRILLGWVNESDSQQDDILKGWASVQAIPRTLWLDSSSSVHLIQRPIEEVKSLRRAEVAVSDLALESGNTREIVGSTGTQLDIEAVFELPKPTASNTQEAENLLASGDLSALVCSPRGSAQNGAIGPFGIAVLAPSDLSELTAIYFEMLPLSGGGWEVRVCSDQSRSSLAPEDDRSVYGSSVRVLSTETTLSLRVLVDHSIVESFAQGGRTVMTARVYPTLAIGDASRLFVFNNGSMPVTLKSISAWSMAPVTFTYI